MPRPDRYREREGAAQAGDPNPEGKDPVEGKAGDPKPGDKAQAREGLVARGRERVAQAEAHAPLDEGEEGRQGSRTGHVTAEGRDPEEVTAEKVARRLGWVPQAEWTRDPAKWVPATQYLDSTPSRIEGLRDRLTRSERAAGAAIDEATRRAREEAEADVRRFAAEGKPEEAAQAARKLADAAPRVNDEARRWVEDRPWLNDDPVAGAAALAITNVAAGQGKSIAEQLDLADQELRRMRPERYGTREQREDRDPPDTREQRQDRRETRQPPDMAGGARNGGGRQGPGRKEKGFADIPAADRETFNRTFRPRGIGEESYARSYWRNKGE